MLICSPHWQNAISSLEYVSVRAGYPRSGMGSRRRTSRPRERPCRACSSRVASTLVDVFIWGRVTSYARRGVPHLVCSAKKATAASASDLPWTRIASQTTHRPPRRARRFPSAQIPPPMRWIVRTTSPRPATATQSPRGSEGLSVPCSRAARLPDQARQNNARQPSVFWSWFCALGFCSSSWRACLILVVLGSEDFKGLPDLFHPRFLALFSRDFGESGTDRSKFLHWNRQ